MTVFRTKQSNLVTYVLANGRLVTIEFTERSQSDAYGFYYCQNAAVAKALRKHPDYGKVFEEHQTESKPKAAKPVKPKAVYDDVKNTQQATQILVEKYGIDKDAINSKADAQRYAKDLNISFPNL